MSLCVIPVAMVTEETSTFTNVPISATQDLRVYLVSKWR